MGQIGQIFRQTGITENLLDFVDVGARANQALAEAIFLTCLAAQTSRGRLKIRCFGIRAEQFRHPLLLGPGRRFALHQSD